MKLLAVMAAFVCLELLALVIVWGVCRILLAIGLQEWVFGFWLLGVPCGLLAAVVLAVRFAIRLRETQ